MPESSLVRVSVTSGSRRVDLVLPGAVPVAELVPELARSVGLLDAHTVHGGYRLVTRDGRELTGDVGLASQGFEDGGLLTVTAAVDEPPPRIYDDVVEAMVDAVERHLSPPDPASAPAVARGAGVVLLGLGAAGLLLASSPLAAVTALGVAVVLLIGAVALSRVRHERGTAVAAAWMASGYAVVTGLLLVPDGAKVGDLLAGAGAAAAAAGLISLVSLDGGRVLALPPLLGGAVLLVTGVVLRVLPLDPALVLTAVLVLVVLVGNALPRLALGAAGTRTGRPSTSTQLVASDPVAVDADGIAADVRLADEILIALSATGGLVLVVAAPFAVSLGPVGTLLAPMCSLLVMLRTRRHRSGGQVLVGLVSGVAGLASGTVATLWLHPGWRPATAVLLVAAGVAVLAAALAPTTPSARRSWMADLLETTALLSLLPVLALATDVFSTVRG